MRNMWSNEIYGGNNEFLMAIYGAMKYIKRNDKYVGRNTSM